MWLAASVTDLKWRPSHIQKTQQTTAKPVQNAKNKNVPPLSKYCRGKPSRLVVNFNDHRDV